MRWLVLALLTTSMVSGCISTPATLDDGPRPVGVDDLQRVLIRGFLDHEENVFRVRFAAVAHDTEVVPFDGFVKVWLEPNEERQDQWIPRFWWGEVTKERFTTDTELPYWEYTADGDFLDGGEAVKLRIEAHLSDGRVIHGERASYA